MKARSAQNENQRSRGFESPVPNEPTRYRNPPITPANLNLTIKTAKRDMTVAKALEMNMNELRRRVEAYETNEEV